VTVPSQLEVVLGRAGSLPVSLRLERPGRGRGRQPTASGVAAAGVTLRLPVTECAWHRDGDTHGPSRTRRTVTVSAIRAWSDRADDTGGDGHGRTRTVAGARPP
jgi:hypothetical protein